MFLLRANHTPLQIPTFTMAFVKLLLKLVGILEIFTSPAVSALINTTHDDTDSNSFTWTGSWNAITVIAPCATCGLKPDAGSVFNNSWHDGSITGNAGGVFTFNGAKSFTTYLLALLNSAIGSAVYLFGVSIPNSTKHGGNIIFVLDNLLSHTYTDTNAGSDFGYDSLFFNATDLSLDTEHKLFFNTAVNTFGGGLALIDYAVVTTDDSASSSLYVCSQVSRAKLGHD